MGDYNAVFISAKLKVRTKDEEAFKKFKKKVKDKLSPRYSSYHATANFINFKRIDSRYIILTLVTQAKYNQGIEEFKNWLRPMVVQGLGLKDAWYINFGEYNQEPIIEYLGDNEIDNSPTFE